MGTCILKEDHPLRVRFGPGLAVHAAQEYTFGGFQRFVTGGGLVTVPEQKRITIACGGIPSRLYEKGSANIKRKHIMPNTTSITCKKCLKALGMDDEYKPSTTRYVVYDNEAEEYYRHSRYSCSWVKHMLDATLYKVRAAAEAHTKRIYYVNAEGNDITRDEYHKVLKRERGLRIHPNSVRRVNRKSPRYDVVTININIEVQDEKSNKSTR